MFQTLALVFTALPSSSFVCEQVLVKQAFVCGQSLDTPQRVWPGQRAECVRAVLGRLSDTAPENTDARQTGILTHKHTCTITQLTKKAPTTNATSQMIREHAYVKDKHTRTHEHTLLTYTAHT